MVGKFLLVVVLFLIKQLAFIVANENNGGNANVFLLCEVCIVKVEKTRLKAFECHHFVKFVEKSSNANQMKITGRNRIFPLLEIHLIR